MLWKSVHLFFLAPFLCPQVMGRYVHGQCTKMQPCKLLIIDRMRSAIVYEMVTIHKVLEYTGYAMQVLWKSVHDYLLCLFTYTLHTFKLLSKYVMTNMSPVRYPLIGKGKIGEGYSNRVARCGLNTANMNISTPNSHCIDNTLFWGNFMDFFDL